MPVELSDEEKTKFSEYAKDLGYDDHAKTTIARLNSESKQRREALEKTESELKTLRDADIARKADDDKRKADEAKAKEDAEKAKQTMDQRLEKLEKKLADAIENGDKAAKKAAEDARNELAEKIEKRDARLKAQAIRAAARERGIIDPDLADMIDAKDVKVDEGEVDLAAVDELIDKHAKAKPHLYKEPSQERERGDNGRFQSRPREKKDGGAGIDWTKLSDEEFERNEQLLRSGKL